MARRIGCSIVALSVAACAAPRAPADDAVARAHAGAESAGDEPSGNAPRGVLVARPAPNACAMPAAVPDRDAAIDLLLSGHALEASAALEARVAARPWEMASLSLYGASLAVAQDDNSAAASVAAGVQPIALEAPLLASPTPGSTKAPASSSPMRLRQESARRNLITDDGDWLAVHTPADRPDRSHPPRHVASTFQGQDLQQLFVHADHAVALYAGSRLVCSAEGKQPRAFSLALPSPDPTTKAPPLEIASAQLVGESLLVQLAYNGYASLSGGRNAYLVAFDARSGHVRWVSAALSANGGNFVVLGRSVITGYGFTAEPDFVFNFDLETGAVLQRLPVKSGPDIFSVDAQRLFVRTYDMDYVFAIESPSASAAEAPALAAAPARAAPRLDPSTPCRVKAAAAAIDARDLVALDRAVDGLQDDHALSPWYLTALESASSLLHQLRDGKSPDLWKSPPGVVAAPPWERTLIAPTAALPKGPAPKLVRASAAPASPVRGTEPQPFRDDQPSFIPPIDDGRRPQGAPEVPTHYGLAALSAIIPSGERTLLIYAGRYLAVLRSKTVERLLDLGALRDPPKANPQWKEFASQEVSYAQVVGDTLYVCNGGGSYAREVFGKKGFLSAIDLVSGELRWRSDALRCNATFVVIGGYLVSGYGFTDEPDFLFVLRLGDGATVAKAKLDSGPDAVTVQGDRIHVETYDHVYDFELK